MSVDHTNSADLIDRVGQVTQHTCRGWSAQVTAIDLKGSHVLKCYFQLDYGPLFGSGLPLSTVSRFGVVWAHRVGR